MWIVGLALRRPYTSVVVSMLMLLFGVGTCVEAPKNIYPYGEDYFLAPCVRLDTACKWLQS